MLPTFNYYFRDVVLEVVALVVAVMLFAAAINWLLLFLELVFE